MKKYPSVLFVFVFALFALNASSVRAFDSGCSSAGPYSTTTGALCTASTAVVCPKGDLFSSATGQPCTAWQDNSGANALLHRELGVGSRGVDVKALQQILKDAGYLLGKVDGVYGPITGSAVTRYQIANSISATGKVDASTLQRINTLPPSIGRISPEPCMPLMRTDGTTSTNCMPAPSPLPTPCPLYMDASGVVSHYCPPYPYPCPPSVSAGNIPERICPPPAPVPNPHPPTISGVSGPQTLNVNQEGTWTVTATSPDGGNLSYSVDWGDQLYALNSSAYPAVRVPQQSATFSHIYSSAGTFTPMFTVTNSTGGSAQTSLSVNVGGVPTSHNFYITPASMTVKIGTTATFQALLDSCPPGAMCFVGPLAVQATWTSSNPNVARVEKVQNIMMMSPTTMPCASNATCAQPGFFSAVVTGVSAGNATITATYLDSAGNTLVSTASVIVS